MAAAASFTASIHYELSEGGLGHLKYSHETTPIIDNSAGFTTSSAVCRP